jgi:large subunit ribosomal protein L29
VKRKEFLELRTKNTDDLDEIVGKRRRELMDLRFALATGSLENPARLKQVKREIAKVLTVRNEQRLAGAGASKDAS